MRSRGIKQIMSEMSENKKSQFRKKVMEDWTNAKLADYFNMTESQVCSIKIMMRISSKGETVTRKGIFKKPSVAVHPQQRTRECMAHGCNTAFISENFGHRLCKEHRAEYVGPGVVYV